MFDITSSALRGAETATIACRLGANSTIPTPRAAVIIAAYFLPGAIPFTYNYIKQLPSKST